MNLPYPLTNPFYSENELAEGYLRAPTPTKRSDTSTHTLIISHTPTPTLSFTLVSVVTMSRYTDKDLY